MTHKRAGDLYISAHTTHIDCLCPILDALEVAPNVTKIALGVIDAITKGRKSSRRVVKIIDEQNCIRLDVTQKRSKQTIRVYSIDHQATKLLVARTARNNDYDLRFRKAAIQ